MADDRGFAVDHKNGNAFSFLPEAGVEHICETFAIWTVLLFPLEEYEKEGSCHKML